MNKSNRYRKLFEAEYLSDFSTDEEDQMFSVGVLSHRPGDGYPRKGHGGERIFASAWERHMLACDIPNVRLWKITRMFYDLPDQNLATFLATVFNWLATNVGQCMVMTALKSGRRHAMVEHWAVQNLRVSYLNGGLGTMDHLRERIGWKAEDLTPAIVRCTFELMAYLDTEAGRLLLEYANERRDRYIKITDRRMRNHHAFRNGWKRA